MKTAHTPLSFLSRRLVFALCAGFVCAACAKAGPDRHPIADVRVDEAKRVLTCVVNGEPARLAFDADEPEDGHPPFSAAFAVADVTGDGVDDLLVRQYIVGNTYSETWSTGSVYEAKGGELVEALTIPPDGFERWRPQYPNNLGICPGPDGTLAIDAGTEKEDGDFSGRSFLLVRQDGEWVARDAPKGFACE